MAKLGNLLKSGDFSDITIKCLVDGSEFKVHQAVLSQSPVFKAMCDSGMKESRTKLIEDQTTRGQVMACLLDFLYKGQLNVLSPTLSFKGEPSKLKCFDKSRWKKTELTTSPNGPTKMVPTHAGGLGVPVEATQPGGEIDTNDLTVIIALYRDLQAVAGFYFLPPLELAATTVLAKIITDTLPHRFNPIGDLLYWQILSEVSQFGPHRLLSEACAKALHQYEVMLDVAVCVPHVKYILTQHDGDIAYHFWKLQAGRIQAKRK